MRRVVVTGLGIVSSIGNNVDEVLVSLREAKPGIVFAPGIRPARFQVPGARRTDARSLRGARPPHHPLHGQGRGLELHRHAAGDRRCGTRGVRRQESADRHRHGFGRPVDPDHRRSRRRHPRKGSAPHRPARRAQGHELDRLGDARDALRHQGRQLLDLVGLRDVQALHRQRLRADPARQAGHRLRRRPRGSRLDDVEPLRRDGRDVVRTSTTTPSKASRAYDRDRDGFVIAGGAGVVVLEELEHAKARGAKIYAELIGYGATSDGYDMVAPSGEGAERCMRLALETVKEPVDYINPHATSTPIGDAKEMDAIRAVFGTGSKAPPISATKSLTGHSLGATGVQESIYCILMMQNDFLCESANIENLDPGVRRHADPSRPEGQRQGRRRALATASASAAPTRRWCSPTRTSARVRRLRPATVRPARAARDAAADGRRRRRGC